MQQVDNPWIALPQRPPYALECDSKLISAFNASANCKYKFDLSLLPEPFFGSPSANVVVLNLNPGWSPLDAEIHSRSDFCDMARRSLAHQLHPYPFLHLQPNGNTPGNRWWSQRTRHLAKEIGFEVVASGLACIEYVGYHSKEYSPTSPRLPSQEYGFNLVRQAMARKAEIIVMRALRVWVSAIPELATYQRLHHGSNPRSPYLSPGNLKGSYSAVAQGLRNAHQHSINTTPARPAAQQR
jgi:hypothetical protein